jgi:hypothetical protein
VRRCQTPEADDQELPDHLLELQLVLDQPSDDQRLLDQRLLDQRLLDQLSPDHLLLDQRLLENIGLVQS